MEHIGPIVRIQVQQSSLKLGQAPRRWYDPSPLRAVPELILSASGVVGRTEDGQTIVDVHHRDHPASKNRGGDNGLSLGFTPLYAQMRTRFGPHLEAGVAGENILVETADTLTEEDLAGGVVVAGEDGRRVDLRRIMVAAPCVEFSRFALRFPAGDRPDQTVTEALRFLDGGTRGYYATYAGEPTVVRVGDRVFLA